VAQSGSPDVARSISLAFLGVSLVEGAFVQGWKQALGALALAYPDRINLYPT
jgi:hypothetical protein